MIYTEQNEMKLLRASQVLVFCALEFRRAFIQSRLSVALTLAGGRHDFGFLRKSLHDATNLYIRHNPHLMTWLPMKNEIWREPYQRNMTWEKNINSNIGRGVNKLHLADLEYRSNGTTPEGELGYGSLAKSRPHRSDRVPPRSSMGWFRPVRDIREVQSGALRQPLWMYFFITTHPCLKSGHGRFCSSVHVFVQGSKVSMLPSAGPSLLTIPPVA